MAEGARQQRAAAPWLSVIIPSHNGERWLAAALQSVVDQREPGIEVILLDSSAAPTSIEIAGRFHGELDIRIERRPDLLPWPAKTDAGAAMARAPWLCMLHQDDLWLPGRAAALRRWLAADPAAAMHLHPARIIDDAGRRLGLWRCPLSPGAVPGQLLLGRLLVQNFIATPAPVIRRDAYLRVGGMDATLWYTADWDLYLKLLDAGEVHYHDDALVSYRIHGSSLTSSGSRGLEDFRRQMQTVLDRHIGKLCTRQRQTRRLAQASIDINVALAAASRGSLIPLLRALATLLALGPLQVRRYLHYSRIIERAYPRLRARLAGGL